MISRIDINNFGQFKNYEWVNGIGNDLEFKKLNIIYGRNYSGKTTMSRIFRCLEKGEIHKHYCNSAFSLLLENGRIITEGDLHPAANEIILRVYNSDFVSENLNWLHNADGSIEPFTILGEKNVELERLIKEIDEKIGDTEKCVGLQHRLNQKINECDIKKQLYLSHENELNEILRSKAASIKLNTAVYDSPIYNITHIRQDISKVSTENQLTEHEKENLKSLLKEQPKQIIPKLREFTPQFDISLNRVKELVEKKISVSTPIAELVSDNLLQEWVRKGISLHKEIRSDCGFCGQALPNNLWEKLDAHFVSESEQLRRDIEIQIEDLESAKNSIEQFFMVEQSKFYSDMRVKLEELEIKRRNEVETYIKNLDFLIFKLKEKLDDIFQHHYLNEVKSNANEIFNLIVDLNLAIEENNMKTSRLSDEQLNAKLLLRLAEVYEFKQTIFFEKHLKQIEDYRKAFNIVDLERKQLEQQIAELLEHRRSLEAQTKDESRGAELVNQYLTHFFGHEELKLVAVNNESVIHFKIQRENVDANNLSEGECSLISFCYFIAKIQDELKSRQDKLIIYIDDPISSLDNNHIFFIYGLIESVIAKPLKYQQLFISTHSLDFLKYIKRLTKPKKAEKNTAYFLMQKKTKGQTSLLKAPNYLKDYITEFNFLFSEIYWCSVDNELAIAEKHHYTFGNNMRKFLEAYLFFKYPNHNLSLDERLEKFFDCDGVAISLINRVVNEYSHLGEQFDRGVAPVDVEEIKKIAFTVIQKIKEKDMEQYTALCESIGINSMAVSISTNDLLPTIVTETNEGPF